jgi:hypothetical protein
VTGRETCVLAIAQTASPAIWTIALAIACRPYIHEMVTNPMLSFYSNYYRGKLAFMLTRIAWRISRHGVKRAAVELHGADN